jgi:hypothetical protein
VCRSWFFPFATCALAAGGCALFFDEDGAGGAGGGSPATASTAAAGSGGAGGADCPGIVRDGDAWGVAFTHTDVHDLTEDPRGGIFFAGIVTGESTPIGQFEAGPRLFVARMDMDGCNLVAHDLGAASRTASITLSHGIHDQRPVLVAWTSSDAQARSTLCAAEAENPGAAGEPCSSNAVVSCTSGGSLASPAVAPTEDPVVTFDAGQADDLDCGEVAGSIPAGAGLYALRLSAPGDPTLVEAGYSRVRTRSTGPHATIAGHCDSSLQKCAGQAQFSLFSETLLPDGMLKDFVRLTTPMAQDTHGVDDQALPGGSAVAYEQFGLSLQRVVSVRFLSVSAVNWRFEDFASVRSAEEISNDAVFVTGFAKGTPTAPGDPIVGVACPDDAGDCSLVGGYAFVAEARAPPMPSVGRSFYLADPTGCAHVEARGGFVRSKSMVAAGNYRCGRLDLGSNLMFDAAADTTSTFVTRQAWDP